MPTFFQIGFGLFLYHILCYLGVFFAALIIIPFLVNFINGKGYGYNFKKTWSVVAWILRMGTGTRNKAS